MSAGEDRKAALERARRVVVKVGSAILTTKTGLDPRAVNRLADQLAGLHDRGLELVLVSSGAVAAGRGLMRSLNQESALELTDLPGRQAASAIGQSRLMHEYDEAFARYGKATAQVLLTRDDLRHRQRFLNARNTMRRLLDWRVIPIVNENDTVAVAELEFGDNDTLASLTIDLIQADLFINLTSADGVFDKNPDQHPGARCLTCIEDIGALDLARMCSGKTSVGSGGMYSKLRAARRAAQLGVPSLVVSGRTPFVLEKVFDGAEMGTWIPACGHRVSHRKFWMAYHADPVGEIRVDAGAARALTEGGKSLLPAGIAGVEGRFAKGALVRISGPDDLGLGVGLSNYSAADLRKIMGRRTSEIEEILGQAPYPEAVHRDNMLLDAAL
ncbi:MAG: glutamate 5-kinase [Desulfovibrio aminophilus]|jgi:glutamate 5-kinase|uniref:glutamate 5-kinase n=3 Tax=Desulfovibrio TaxID=872 RepID=UPI00040A51E7|nr:glutamate 5-kinase [Desulfovibrio aminophilus]MDY0306794.1 glutamate 5-kinase [Desulfovibrionaceae bacterium]